MSDQMIANANRNNRPNTVKPGRYVIYGNTVFYQSVDGKLTTVCPINYKYLSFLGKVTVIPTP